MPATSNQISPYPSRADCDNVAVDSGSSPILISAFRRRTERRGKRSIHLLRQPMRAHFGTAVKDKKFHRRPSTMDQRTA
jgi:hypothetical protein